MADNYRQIMKAVMDFFQLHLPDLHVTEDILLKPTADQVKRIYTALLIFSGLKTEKQLLNDAESYLISDDILLGGRRALILNGTMEYFVQNAMPSGNWSLRDLSNPDHRRTLVFIKELINFSLFAQDRHTELEKVFEEKEKRERDDLQLRFNLDSFNTEAEKKARELEKFRGRKCELFRDREELVRSSAQFRALKVQVQEQRDMLKGQLDAKNQFKARLEEQLRELDENNQDLRGKLVKSPERLHDEIREMEKKNHDRAQTIQDCESSINQMRQQTDILSTEANRHLDLFKAEFEAIKHDVGVWENSQRVRTQLLMQYDREKSEMVKLEGEEKELARRLENDLGDLSSRLQRCQNKIEHLRSLSTQHNENIAIYSEQIKNSQAEYIACQKRVEELKRKLEDHPTDPLKNVISLKEREIEAEVSEIDRCNERLKTEIIQLDSNVSSLRAHYDDVKQKSLDGLRQLHEINLNK